MLRLGLGCAVSTVSACAVLPLRSSLLRLGLAVLPFTAAHSDLFCKVPGLAEISQLPLSLWNLLSGRMDLFSVVQRSTEVHHRCVQRGTGLQNLKRMICVGL